MKPGLTLQSFNKVLPEDDADVNSVHLHLDRAAGHVISTDITLDENNGSANVNCFQVVGSVEVYRIYGTVKTATTFANCTAAYFDLYDSSNPFVITKNDGVLSGLGVGAFFTKEAIKTVTMTVIDNVAGSVTEPTTEKKQFTPFIVTQKTGADTFIRFNYTTSDAPIDAVLTIYVEYRTPPVGGSLTVV